MAKSVRDRNPFIVGVISVLVILAIVGGAFAFGILHLFKAEYTVKIVFSDASGIQKGNNVKVAGIKVGQVTGITADREHGDVVVSALVSAGTKLPVDAHGEIALETLLGTKSLRLSGTPRLGVGDLKDQSQADRAALPGICATEKHPCIPLVDASGVTRTSTPVDVFEITKIGTKSINATDTDQLNNLIVTLADITGGQKDQVAALLNGVNQLSTTLNSRDAQLRTLLDRVDALTAVLADKDQTLVALIDRSKQILDLLNARHQQITALFGNAADATAELDRLVTGTDGQRLNGILQGLHPILEEVKGAQAVLDRALTLVGPGGYGLGISPTHGPWQDIYVQAIGVDLLQALSGSTNPSP